MLVSAILNDFADHVLALRALKGAFIVIRTIGFDPASHIGQPQLGQYGSESTRRSGSKL